MLFLCLRGKIEIESLRVEGSRVDEVSNFRVEGL
jgi:hypothetical protein